MEFPENFNTTRSIELQTVIQHKILIGILDWGLGHTTRCIPLISYLLQFQCQIFIAATPEQKIILEKEFKGLHFVGFEGYNVQYPLNGKYLSLSILRQIPRLARVIRREKAWLSHMMKIHHFNAIISDNRYGFYHSGVKSIFITHQLAIISGAGGAADYILKLIHDRFIKQFTACWIPDVFSHPNLSGKLGHPAHLPSNYSYLGPISRMIPMESTGKLDLLVILSGPEPQRTKLEKILMVQLQKFSGTYLLIRGLPGTEPNQNPQVLPYLEAQALNQKLTEASLVICRSGYSGIMDLVKLKKKAILIPTPGQTEQEYLAIYLEKHHMFLRAEQNGFNLLESIQRASSFPFSLPDFDFNEYKTVLSRFIQSL